MTDAATPPEPSRLAAVVDGAPLDPEAARALWTEFSAHMDEHRGDMSGFATKKGWKSVAPEYQRGKAVLLVRTGGPMKAPPPKPAFAAPPARAPKQQADPSRARKQADPRASKGPPPQKKGPAPQAKKGPPPQAKKGPAPQAKKGPPPQAKKGPPPKKRP